MKHKLFALLPLFLWVTACSLSPATPGVNEPTAAQVSPSATPLLPTVTVPPSATVPPTTAPWVLPTVASRHIEAISAQNIEQVALLIRLGKGMVDDLAYKPDGKTLAIVTTQGVYLYDAQTLAEIASYPSAGDISPVQIAFNRQGDLLALGEQQETDLCYLVLWRFSDGRWQQIGKAEAFIECLAEALSPDGEYLASVNYDTRLATVWRTSDLAQVQAFPLEYPGDIYSIFVRLAFSGENSLAIEEGSFVSVYDVTTGKLLRRLEEPGMTSLQLLAISRDGQVLAARDSAAQKIPVWNLRNNALTLLEDAYEGWQGNAQLLLSPAGDLAAITHGSDPSSSYTEDWVDVRQTSDGAALAKISTPSWNSFPGSAFSPDGSVLVTWQEGVDFWQARDGARLASLPGYERYEGILSPDGSLLADRAGPRIWLVRLSDGQVVQTLEGAGDPDPGMLVFSPDGSLLASIHVPGTVEVWNAASGMLEKTYELQGSGNNYAILPRGNFMVVQEPEGTTVSLVNIWDGAVLKTFPGPKIDEFGNLLASISPDLGLFAAGATNGPIEVWQEGKDAPLYTLTAPFEWTALSFSPDGESLVTVSDTVQVWNARDSKLRFSPTGVLTTWNDALFSPDGSLLVTVNQGMLHLWSMDDGALLHSLEALPPAVFSPDGAILVTSGQGIIQFWRVSDGALLRALEGTTIPVAFSSDGRLLISMRDGVVETWGVSAP